MSIKLLFHTALGPALLEGVGLVGYAQQDSVSFSPHQKADVQQFESHPFLPRQTAPSPGSSEVLSDSYTADGEEGLGQPYVSLT